MTESAGEQPAPAMRAQRPGVDRHMLVGATLGALVAVAVVTNVRLVARGPDLASGKPWRTSSTLAKCTPAAYSCANSPTAIFFHTNEEENPWLEIDLQHALRFSSVRVVNRSDCCTERAQPLIVEVSDDTQTWREVARNNTVFSVWKPRFEAQLARYVRLRVPRKTALHLEAVEVRE